MGFPVLVSGRGLVDSEEMTVDRAVQEYDERLRFGKNEQTGEYCIFIKMPPNYDGGVGLGGWGPYLPLLSFQREIPHPDYAIKRLHQSDTMRHGQKILDDTNRRNSETKKAAAAIADDASGQVAEAMEWAMRKKGTHPSPRVFVPDSKGE